MSLDERWRRILEDLRGQGRYRQLTLPRGIDFSSNDYLGYGSVVGSLRESTRPLAERADYTLSRSGTASRLLRGHHAIWEEVENALAAWHQTEAALVMTNGYVANEGLLSTVIEPHDWVASDECNHASIIDGLRLTKAERFVFRHNDLSDLEAGLREAAKGASPERQRFVVTESLFGMEGDRAPLRELVALAERFGAHVIVDEAHATGCFGPAGSGLVDAAGLRSRVLATVHTGGKALGVPGAYVCGSSRLKELLVNRCRHFLFTTALPPLVGQWWLETLARVKGDDSGRQSLHSAAEGFRAELRRLGVRAAGAHYIVPIILGDDRRALDAAEGLRAQGSDIRAIRPPTVPAGTARLRISIHADHDPGALHAVARAVADAAKNLAGQGP
jgi:8-amino-7-oxononanoate synthase